MSFDEAGDAENRRKHARWDREGLNCRVEQDRVGRWYLVCALCGGSKRSLFGEAWAVNGKLWHDASGTHYWVRERVLRERES